MQHSETRHVNDLPGRTPGKITVALDADDTLWDNESSFAETEERFRELVSTWVDGETADERLIAIETANVDVYGYGVKGFVLSMIEAALEVSGRLVTTDQIEQIIGWGKGLLSSHADLLPGVTETVKQLASERRTLIITKGDLHHQARRVAASGLGDLVEAVEIVAEKDPSTYATILDRHSIDRRGFVMVGNSLKSDVLPVLELGGQAIHIPFHVTWALEKIEPPTEVTWHEASSIREVPGLIAQMEDTRS